MRTTNKRKTNGRKKYVRKNTHKKQSKNHSGIRRSEAKVNCKYKKTRRTGKKGGGFIRSNQGIGDYDEGSIITFFTYIRDNKGLLFDDGIFNLNSLFQKFSQIIHKKFGQDIGDLSTLRSDELMSDAVSVPPLNLKDKEFMERFIETRLNVDSLYLYIKHLIQDYGKVNDHSTDEIIVYSILEGLHVFIGKFSRDHVIETVFSEVKSKYQEKLKGMDYHTIFREKYNNYLDTPGELGDAQLETLFDILKYLGFGKDDYLNLKVVFEYLSPVNE